MKKLNAYNKNLIDNIYIYLSTLNINVSYSNKNFVFSFQNRYYVESKLKTNLHTELKKLFRKHILEKHLAHLFCK